MLNMQKLAKQMKKIELQVITDMNGISHYYDDKNIHFYRSPEDFFISKRNK